jgi:hypothetical protein
MKREDKSMLVMFLLIVFAAAVAFLSAAGAKEATVTGKVTKEGTIAADNGQIYVVTGVKADEVLSNVDKRVQAKGSVMEQHGKKIIKVKDVRVMKEGTVEKREWGEPFEGWPYVIYP